MEKLFLEVKSKVKIKIAKEELAKLPKKTALAATVQFVDQMKEIKERLGSKAEVKKGRQKYPGQVLGCDVSAVENVKADAILYIGDGRFHPIAIKLKTNKDVYILNPYTSKITKLETKDMKDYQ